MKRAVRAVYSVLPERMKVPLRWMRVRLRAIPYHGTGRFCPICQKSSKVFKSFGERSRKDAECAHCGSVERNRLVWLYLRERTDLSELRGKNMLHVAPERCFENRFKRLIGGGYLSADLYNPRAMVKMDITDIRFPDESFDIIYCSHVLEHVMEDRKAMSEFYRTLKKDGWAILLVPISSDKTFEDPTITAPQARLEAFGKSDHVRRYGPDYVDRLREAGFNVEVATAADLVTSEDIERFGLNPPAVGEIYFCTK